MKLKSLLLASAAAAVLLPSPTLLAAGMTANSRVSNTPKPGLLQPRAESVVQAPASLVRGWSNAFDADPGWTGGWIRPVTYTIVQSVDGDYFYARPVGKRNWHPTSVYSKAYGKVVPYPVDYTSLQAAALRTGEAKSEIEPVPQAPVPETIPIEGPTN